ncbi:MAG: DNA gyrase subunit B [Clostridia bacterium]|nr:DNA gyrase subunit B [Clostridia bacterium]
MATTDKNATTANASTKSYGAKDIQVLQGLDAVRLRPGMYIGTTSLAGLHHILWEIVDNAVDEAANGFANKVDVILNADNSCTVIDNGRGIPVDIHPKLKIPGVQVVFTELHAGGKFNDSNYSYSGGLHGVGASVTNALSRWLKCTVYKGKKAYSMEFAAVEKSKNKIRCGVCQGGLTEYILPKERHGTEVCFLADDRVFEETFYNLKTIKSRLRELAFLNKGITFTITDNRIYEGHEESTYSEYKYDGGLNDFINYLNRGSTKLFEKPIYFAGEYEGIKAEIVIQYTDGYTESTHSYVNNIPTKEGGMHETGFKIGITRVFNDYARKNKYLKEKDENYHGDDFRVGMTAVISVKMKNVQFEGQTKGKLGNPEAKVALEHIVSGVLPSVIEVKGMGKTMEAIMKKSEAAAKERESVRRAKEVARAKNSIDNFYLVGKLSSCTGKNPVDNELFIVEGDSAGGTAKQGRDRKTQAILPLRGKPLNVEKNRVDKVLANEEIRMIISALGTGILDDFKIEDLKVHKVIILSDADQDGLHIRSILLTFFYRYMRDLITNGHLYIGQPPLYKIQKGNNIKYAFNDKELKEYTKEIGKGYTVQRYKGLGEMNFDQLRDTTLNKVTRLLEMVSIEDAVEAERMINILMGDSMEERKAYIQENSNFNKVDKFKPVRNKE